MAKTYRVYDPDQLLLLPPSLSEWVPEGHLARFVSDVVDELDLSKIEASYDEDRGQPPYHPRMMVKVLLYGYATGVYSSRRIATHLHDSVAFRFLAAGNWPDFRTVNGFRLRHGEALKQLFEQVLRLCDRAGLVKLGKVAVDGTKIKANASKHKAMSYGRLVEREKQIEAQVAEMLKRAEKTDREEDERFGADKRGDELPAELAHKASRLKKIREAKAALEQEARDKAVEAGRKNAEEATPKAKAQRNFTDSESRIQKTSDGFIQGYNAQAAVDSQSQIIVGQHVTQASPDVNELLPVVAAIGRVLRRKPKKVLADAGYWSEENHRGLEAKGIEPYIAPRRYKHSEPIPRAPKGRIPASLSLKDRMQRKLQTVAGLAIYRLRMVLPEPVFGQIKAARGFRQFLRRGLTKVGQEWALVATVHNLRKLHLAQTA